VVGGEILLMSELEEQKEQFRQQRVPFDKCVAAEQTLVSKLFLHRAKVDSLEVSPDQVEGEMDRRLRYFMQQFGSVERLEEFYDKKLVEIKAEFRKSLKDQLLIQQMQGQVSQSVIITPEDIADYFETIPKDSLPLINAEVKVSHIVMFPPLDPEQVKSVKDKLKQYKEQSESGEREFSTLAILYSEDPGSATKGGELGMVSKGSMVAEFDAVALSLKNGEVSDVFKTQFGYHIIQMIERRGESYNARHILLKPGVSADALMKVESRLDSISTLISEGKMSFENAAEQFSMDDDTKSSGGQIINPATGAAAFSMTEIEPQLFLSIDNLDVDDISNPVVYTSSSQKKGYRLVKLNSRTEPHTANLVDDYQIIQNVAFENLKQKEIDKWIKTNLKRTYIKLNEDLEVCEFRFKWNKK
jgi:peptidyl-prolyl cis-trans isomerase SurA